MEDEDFIVKQTIPAPAQFYFELIRDAEHIEQTFSVYPSKEELFKDIIAAYRQVIKELYDRVAVSYKSMTVHGVLS